MAKKKKSPNPFRKTWDSDPQPGEHEIDKDEIDEITEKRTFEYHNKPSLGNRFYIFHEKGDDLVGTVTGKPIQNVKRSSSWPIKLESGEVVEVFQNRILHPRLEKCIGRKVRIVYIGREHVGRGHAMKVYRVYLIEHGTETEVTIRKRKKKRRKT